MVDELKSTVSDKLNSAADHKITTVLGMVSGILGIMIEPAARDACYNAVVNSTSPILTGTLLITGLALTAFGPSIKKVDVEWQLRKLTKKAIAESVDNTMP